MRMYETGCIGPCQDDVEALAEKLHSAEIGPNPHPCSPFGMRSRLRDLWPVDQERYRRMARAVLGARE